MDISPIPENSQVYPLLQKGIENPEDILRVYWAVESDVRNGTITYVQGCMITVVVGSSQEMKHKQVRKLLRQLPVEERRAVLNDVQTILHNLLLGLPWPKLYESSGTIN